MARWLAPALGVLILAIGASVGAIIWSQCDDKATCDRGMLSAVLNDGIVRAEQAGQVQFDVVRPPGCTDADLADVLPAVTRSWHTMPGGVIMREPSHPGS